jgi:hypothetical protein
MIEINDPYARGVGAESIQKAMNPIQGVLNAILQQKAEGALRQSGINSLRSLGVPEKEAALLAQLQPKDQWNALAQSGMTSSIAPTMGKKGAAVQGYERLNEPSNKIIDAEASEAQIMADELSNMKRLIQSGKVSSGLFWGSLPDRLQNEETQQYQASSNTIAGILANKGGMATEFKIKFAQLQKPTIWQHQGTQLKLIDKLMEEARRPLMKRAIRDKIIDSYGGVQPRNLSMLVNKYYNTYKNNADPLGLENYGYSSDTNKFDEVDQIPMNASFRDTQTGEMFKKTPQGIVKVQ